MASKWSVYLSFAPADIEFVRKISWFLDENGAKIQNSVGGLAGGSNWHKEIALAIEECDAVIAVLSANSNISKWVDYEIYFALGKGKTVIPVLIGDSVNIPPPLKIYQYLDARAKPPDEIGKQLLRRLEGKKRDKATEISPDAVAQAQQKILDTPDPHRIFIAYARKHRPTAKKIADILSRKGNAVFYDAHIRAGAQWRQIIQKALDDASHVVIIWTSEAANSDEVEREVSYALAEGKVIIPLLSPDIPKLPYHLHGLHYLILDGDVEAIEADLLNAIERHSNDGIWDS